MLQDVGLCIRETAYALFQDSAVRLHIDISEISATLSLSEKQRREIHLIAKECLTNIFRHAHARQVWLSLRTESNTLSIVIRDDGVGFDVSNDTSGLVLKSIRQRIDDLQRHLRI
ncbi:hypothetical protein GCM10028807_42010 [Spirosoma daeguense]